MSTLCRDDMGYPFRPSLRIAEFPCSANERNKRAAGAAAYARALHLGYCLSTARSLRRTAQREWVQGESPHDTALRVVRPMPDSATTPPGAA